MLIYLTQQSIQLYLEFIQNVVFINIYNHIQISFCVGVCVVHLVRLTYETRYFVCVYCFYFTFTMNTMEKEKYRFWPLGLFQKWAKKFVICVLPR